MSLSHEELMRLHDGELDEERERELCEQLDDEGHELLAGLDQVGDWVRELAEQQEPEGIADAVMAEIAAEQAEPGSARAGQVVQPSRWRRAAPAVAGALALAAAAALLVRAMAPATPTPEAQRPLASSSQVVPQPHPAAAPQPEADEAGPAVAIESVDFGSHDGTIFMVSAGDEVTPVVWLTDSADRGDRTEPL